MDFIRSLEPAELARLESRWGSFPVQRHTIHVDDPFLSGPQQRLVSDRRRAEICYVMHRGDPADGVLLHVKTIYPDGAFRLPTGGIHEGESVEGTLVRELYEETGLTVTEWACDGAGPWMEGASTGVRVERFLGVTGYTFHHARLGQRSFATYYFLTQMPATAEPAPTDPGELIAAWSWVPSAQLETVGERLAEVGLLTPAWADWGRYRSFAHRFVGAALA